MGSNNSELNSALWLSCDVLRGSMDVSHYKSYVLVMLFIKYFSDRHTCSSSDLVKIPKGAHFSDLLALKGQSSIGHDINNNIIAPIFEANKLPYKPDFNDARRLGHGKEIVEKLTKLIGIFEHEAFDFTDDSKAEEVSEVFDCFIQELANSSGKAFGEFTTPKGVGQLLAKLALSGKACEQELSVYDPACGAGSLLYRAAEETNSKVDLYGEELYGETATLAAIRMLFDGKAANVACGDVISSPGHKNDGGLKKFDLIVSNPPFSTRNWGHDLVSSEDVYDRFSFGIPPSSCGDYAFIQHMIASLNDKGRIATLTTFGILFRGGAEEEIRKNLVESDLIEAIIGLPSNLLTYSGIPTCILIINKDKTESLKNKILFINAGNEFEKHGNQNKLLPENIERISEAFNTLNQEELFSRIVPLDEIKENKYNLNIPRYVDNSETGALLRQYYEKFSKSCLGDVALEINSVSKGKTFQHKDNSLYITQQGVSKTTVCLDELANRHSNYFQVVLNDKVINTYLSHFFESDIGQHALSAITNTLTIRRITKEALRDCILALPSLEDQKKNIEIHRKISELETSLKDIKGELAITPTLSGDFDDQLDRMLEAANKWTKTDDIRNLIRKGESKTLEFKETFSFCLRERKKADYVELSALKTIAAFLNSEGGILLVGVSDDLQVKGLDIELDKFHKGDRDKFLLHFKNKIKSRIGADFYPFMNYDLIKVDGLHVLKCVCKQSTDPCFLDGKDLYVRTNPATDKLEGAQQWQYLSNHFQQIQQVKEPS